MKTAIIIPTFNEELTIASCIRSVKAGDEGSDVIVVDGGSSDRTTVIAAQNGASVVSSTPCRGAQMNRGAEMADADLLVFLHADTVLPKDWSHGIDRLFSGEGVDVALFRSRFVPTHPLLDFYSLFTRLPWRWTMYGDQCIVCRKAFFHRLGGYPDWPLFEDVCFLKKATEKTSVRRIPLEVQTSGRKFRENGMLRQQWRNAMHMLSYHLGESPESVAEKYYRGRTVGETEIRPFSLSERS